MRTHLVSALLFGLGAVSIGACTHVVEPAGSSESGVTRNPEGGACKTSADCALGAKYCLPNASGKLVCQSKVDTGYGGCGKVGNEIGVGRACVAGACTGSGRAGTCVELPGLDTSICSRTCAADAECGSSAFCGKTSASGSNVCIPFNCACTASNATTDLANAALAAVGKDACEVGHRFGDLGRVYGEDIAHDAVRPSIYQRLYHAPMAIPHAGRQIAS